MDVGGLTNCAGHTVWCYELRVCPASGWAGQVFRVYDVHKRLTRCWVNAYCALELLDGKAIHHNATVRIVVEGPTASAQLERPAGLPGCNGSYGPAANRLVEE